jgi:hypothetical protein
MGKSTCTSTATPAAADRETREAAYDRRRRYALRAESAGNGHLRLIAELLSVTDHLAESYLSGHGSGCRCDNCQHHSAGDLASIRRDLTTLALTCQQVRSGVAGLLAYEDAADRGLVEQLVGAETHTDGGILTELADLSNVVDVRYEMEAELESEDVKTADEPTVVIAGA